MSIYLEPVCPLFSLGPSKTRSFPVKTRVIWVPGIYFNHLVGLVCKVSGYFVWFHGPKWLQLIAEVFVSEFSQGAKRKTSGVLLSKSPHLWWYTPRKLTFDWFAWLEKKTTMRLVGFPNSPKKKSIAGWWFQIFFMFTSTWGNDPIWLIFFKGVGSTTN